MDKKTYRFLSLSPQIKEFLAGLLAERKPFNEGRMPEIEVSIGNFSASRS